MSFKGLSTVYKATPLYWLSVQQTELGATCSFFFHPEDDHQDVHHHPASAVGDHPTKGPCKKCKDSVGGIWERGNSLSAGAFKNGQNALNIGP